ncbi:MAG: O-antigen polymerase [Stygiobacter sp.]|nr:MAG: O-antigen polymerase [Stygiobacter sp.]
MLHGWDSKDKSKVENVTTNGRAYSVVLIGADTLLIADYEKGIAAYKGRKLLQTIPTEAPITRINFWKENYYLAYSLDSRFFVVEKEPTGKFKIAKYFISPGTTRDFAIAQEKLYVADKDSGLTIYSDPAKIEMKLNFFKAGGIATVDANEKYVAQYFENPGSVKIFTTENGSSVKMIDSIRFDTSIKYLWFAHNILLFQNDNSLIQYKIENEKVSELKRLPIVGITRMKFVDTTAYALTIDGKIFVGTPEAKGGFAFNELINLGYPCTDFDVKGEQILVSSFKRNRILSIFDPNHETNFERLNIWRVGLKIFKDYPILGVGDIDLGNLYRKYKDDYLKENFGHLHNNFMQWLVTLGVVGFSAVMFLMVGILLMHWKIYRTLKNEPVASSFAIGAIAALVGFLASGLGEYNFGDQEIITMVWFTVGLNLAFYLNYKNNAEKVEA